MAEFCPECWNKLNDKHLAPFEYRLSYGLDLCEGCGEEKRVVMGERNGVEILFYFLGRLLLLPYTVYKRYRSRKAAQTEQTELDTQKEPDGQ